MADPPGAVRCPHCHEVVSVSPDWRLAVCPACAGVIVRMDSDSTYD